MNDPEKIIAAFIESLNEDSHQKWLDKAAGLLRIYFRGRERAYTAEDIVSEVIIRTLDEGGRNWDMENVALDAYMMKTIESVVWNISRKDLRFKTVDFKENRDDPFITDLLNRHVEGPEEIYKDNEYMELYECCLELLSGDPECMEVFLEMRNGAKSEQIERKLGMSPNKLLSVKQKIRRALRRKIFYNNT